MAERTGVFIITAVETTESFDDFIRRTVMPSDGYFETEAAAKTEVKRMRYRAIYDDVEVVELGKLG